VDNLGSKTVVVCLMGFYGYDDKGTQLTYADFKWAGELKAGQSDETITVPKKVDGVTLWETTYHGIKFEGDEKNTMDWTRSPGARPKGG
jgi:hypothetical protein